MSYEKRFVCIANSWKFGNGFCVAGIEWPAATHSATFIRPISSRQGSQLVIPDHQLDSGRAVQPLDVVDATLLEHRPSGCQVENHLIDPTHRWRLIGRVASAEIVRLAKDRAPIWIDGYSTSEEGMNNKIPEGLSETVGSSLALVRPVRPVVRKVIKVKNGREKSQLRLRFTLGKQLYDLAVTDPLFNARFAETGLGDHPFAEDVLLCVSLTEPEYGYRYKLVAGVIPL